MSKEGNIYKLYCDGVDEFYIGSSSDMKERKRFHKYDCKNPNLRKYNSKVYQYIRENKGFDKWKFEILETALFENKTALRVREQHYINLLKPSLNSQKAYITGEEKKIQRQILNKAFNDRNCGKNIECICGSKTSQANKTRHNKSKKHQKYLKTINNITINITNLNINK